MGSPTDRHEPDACKEGEGCKPCQIEESRRKALAAAKEVPKHRPTAAQRKTALGIAIRQASIGVFLLVVALAGCAPIDVAATHAMKQALLCARNATNPDNPPEVRDTERDNFKAWDSQYFTLTGDHVSPELAARVAEGVAEVSSR